MGTAKSMTTNVDQGDYPLANTRAARMMAEAIEKKSKSGTSQRELGRLLGYKTSVTISHMALGRVPIPIDRAVDFARVMEMPRADFLLAVLEQRHPDIDFMRILVGNKGNLSKDGSSSYMVDELEALAGDKLEKLPVERLNVIREAAADANPKRRWMNIPETAIMEVIRKERPDIVQRGLDPEKAKNLREFLAQL